LKTLYFYIFI